MKRVKIIRDIILLRHINIFTDHYFKQLVCRHLCKHIIYDTNIKQNKQNDMNCNILNKYFKVHRKCTTSVALNIK